MCSIYFTLPAEDVGPELKEKFEQAQPFTTPTSSFAKQQRQAFKEYRPGSKDLLDDYIYKKRERRRRSSCKVLLVSQFTLFYQEVYIALNICFVQSLILDLSKVMHVKKIMTIKCELVKGPKKRYCQKCNLLDSRPLP